MIVFFDEMDSIFRPAAPASARRRDHGRAAAARSEIDGVEGLENVIVIGRQTART